MAREKRNVFSKILFFLVIILISMYIIGYFIFSKYSYPNTILNNKASGLKPLDSIFDVVEMKELIIKDKDNKEYILNPRELDFVSDYEKEVEVVQNEVLWPIEIFQEHNYENVIVKAVNESNLKRWINNSDLIQRAEAPVDAKIEKENNQYVIKNEIEGNTLNKDKLYKKIEKSYLNSENEIILKEEYIEPKIITKDLEKKAELLNRINSKNIIIKAPNGTEISIAENLDDFIDEKNAEIDRNKINSYVNSLKGEYDNFNKERTFKTFTGAEVSVPPGNFGVQINLDESVNTIYKALTEENASSNGVIELVYTNNAFNNGEIGNTYIEISIADQKMLFYKNGELIVDTPIITGLPNGIYNTPRGVWNVWIKETNRYLQGKNLDGSKYKSWVNFWMQIDHTGVGIHDSSWQSAYGGNLYQSLGSHGCINTPYDACKLIYDNLDMGTPAIVY